LFLSPLTKKPQVLLKPAVYRLLIFFLWASAELLTTGFGHTKPIIPVVAGIKGRSGGKEESGHRKLHKNL
jgi:hypothetical protein